MEYQDFMKTFIAILLLLSCSARSDLTSFAWEGDSLQDENSVQVAAGNPVLDYVGLTIFNDLNLSVIGNEIDISSILASTFHSFTSPLEVVGAAPPPIAGDYFSDLFTGDGSYAGETAYLLIHQGNGIIQIGDFIGISSVGFAVLELDPDGPGGNPPGIQQTFDGGLIITNVQVIPEPTTIAILIMAILGICGFRKHIRKS